MRSIECSKRYASCSLLLEASQKMIKLNNLFGTKIGIDLGTSTTKVADPSGEIIYEQPTVVAISRKDNIVVAVGEEAQSMIGRAPETILVVRPMKDGAIADYLITQALLQHCLRKTVGKTIVKPETMICAPVGITPVHRDSVRDASEAAGARQPTHIIPEPLAAAIGAEVPIGSADGAMVVDIGGGRAEAAVISMFGMVAKGSIRVGGDKLDQAIQKYLSSRHELIIGERTAEQIKIQIGSAITVDDPEKIRVRGKHLTGQPRIVTIDSNEIAKALKEPLLQIVNLIRGVLEQTEPELSSDIAERGILITGGSANLQGLGIYLREMLQVACYIAESPEDVVVRGAAIALDFAPAIERIMLSATDELYVTSRQM